MNWPYQLPLPKETFGIALAIIALLALIVWGSSESRRGKFATDFDATWTCFNAQPGYPACVKQGGK